VLRRAKLWIVWYVSVVVLWLAFVDTLALAELVRTQALIRFHMEPRWLRDLRVLPWQVLRDSWLLGVALWRPLTGHPVRGVFRVVPFPTERDDARSGARRALATGVLSLAPTPTWSGSRGTRVSCSSTSSFPSRARRSLPACWRSGVSDE
jgi:hypothetical protein